MPRWRLVRPRACVDFSDGEYGQAQEDGGDTAVRQGAADRDGVIDGSEGDATAHDGIDAVDQGLRYFGAVCDGAFVDFRSLPPCFAQEDGGDASCIAVAKVRDVAGYGCHFCVGNRYPTYSAPVTVVFLIISMV